MILDQATESDQNEIPRDMEVDDIFGKPISFMYVIVKSIRYLKQHLLDALHSRKDETGMKDVRWVITVSALWTDQAKHMRDCAIEAGILEDALSLAYEPEVEAVFYKQLLVDRDSGANSSIVKESEILMVVDIGGGTADVTEHQEESGKKMMSTLTVSGGPWGGARVNAAFMSFFKETFGDKVIRRLKKKETGDYLELIREFEVKKRNTDILKEGKDLIIKLPVALLELYEEINGKSFENSTDCFTLNKDKMHIKPFKFDSFFRETISNITEHLKSVLDGDKISVATILMVGGFSECKLVSDAIKEAFPRQNPVTPEEAGMAVLKGAVLYGQRPESIATVYKRQ
ncbi:heat shock 70 kDa protein 12B-like [Pecten maximus]|uniref:heat shock 70 kDa protein 12B-like n=1 Tax=Pecten maximus TaxID=6579 RepID=UPI001458CF2E|nr:heat shock 70 kDa protein 12B-like [Pecten maximus]